MATDFLISFDDLKAGSAAVKRLVQAFNRAGATVASSDIDPKTKRTSGVNYRQVMITFTDNQKVLLGVKTTGDIFEVRVNGAALAIKNQDSQIKAVGEIAKALDAGRAKFQAKMARTKVALPKGITTAAPRMEQRLREAETTLDAEIAAAQARVAELRAELGEPVMDGVSREKDMFWVLKEEYGVIPANAPVVAILWAAGRVWANGGDWKSQLDKLNKERERQGKPIAYSSDVVKIDRDDTMDSTHTAAGETFDGGEWDTLVGMKQAGKVEDGDVPSKASRDSLVERGLVERGEGMNWLTDKGKEVAAALDAVGGLYVWHYDRATGYWDMERTVTFETAEQWLKVWRDDMPKDAFRVAKNRPNGRPKADDYRDGKALDAVDVPLDTFKRPEVIEAQAIAARLAAGDILDAADLSHALATLHSALDVVETNHPINLAEGDIAQADLEEKAAESFRDAIKILQERKPIAA